MNTKRFYAGEALKFGWNTTRSNIAFFIGLLLVAWSIRIVPSSALRLLPDISLASTIGMTVFFCLVSMMVHVVLVRISINFVDGQQDRLLLSSSCISLFPLFLIGAILYSLIAGGTIFAGALLLSIVSTIKPIPYHLSPFFEVFVMSLFGIRAIAWCVQFQFFDYLIIDRGLGPVESLKESSILTKGIESLQESSVLTKGARWHLFLFDLGILLINLVGVAALGVGLFITIPISMVAMAFVYRKLLSQTAPVEEVSEETMERMATEEAQLRAERHIESIKDLLPDLGELRNAAADPDMTTRHWAIQELKRRGGEDAQGVLETLLHDEADDVRRAAQDAMDEIRNGTRSGKKSNH